MDGNYFEYDAKSRTIVEEEISSIHQMHEINRDVRLMEAGVPRTQEPLHASFQRQRSQKSKRQKKERVGARIPIGSSNDRS